MSTIQWLTLRLRYAQGERPLPARAESFASGPPERRRAAPQLKDAQDTLRGESGGVEADRAWITITWNPY